MARIVGNLDSRRLAPEPDLLGNFFHLIALHLDRDVDLRDWRMSLQGSSKQAPESTDCGVFCGVAVCLLYSDIR